MHNYYIKNALGCYSLIILIVNCSLSHHDRVQEIGLLGVSVSALLVEAFLDEVDVVGEGDQDEGPLGHDGRHQDTVQV